MKKLIITALVAMSLIACNKEKNVSPIKHKILISYSGTNANSCPDYSDRFFGALNISYNNTALYYTENLPIPDSLFSFDAYENDIIYVRFKNVSLNTTDCVHYNYGTLQDGRVEIYQDNKLILKDEGIKDISLNYQVK